MNYAVEHKAVRGPITYPILMRGVGEGEQPIVLFTGPCTGMKLQAGGFRKSEGGWIPATDVANWEPFVGTITVSA